MDVAPEDAPEVVPDDAPEELVLPEELLPDVLPELSLIHISEPTRP